MSTTYYPVMAYRMVSLEKPVAPQALGEVIYDSWCTTAHVPTATCKPVKGVALPLTVPTMNVYKDLQGKVNALLAHGRMATIGVDGRPGPNTQNGLLKAARHARDLGLAPPTRISTYVIANQTIPIDVIAKWADEISDGLQQSIARLGAVAVPAPPQSRPSQPAPVGIGIPGGVVNPPADVIISSAGGGFLAGLGIPTPLGIAAGVVGLLALHRMSKTGAPRRRARRR